MLVESSGSCWKRVNVSVDLLNRLSPPWVPTHSTPRLSSRRTVTVSWLRLNGLPASCLKCINVSVSGLKRFSPPPNVPTQSVPSDPACKLSTQVSDREEESYGSR